LEITRVLFNYYPRSSNWPFFRSLDGEKTILEAPRSWWGTLGEENKGWIGRSRKSEVIYRFLKVTSRLSSLELQSPFVLHNREWDETDDTIALIFSLTSTLSSLKHLRFIHTPSTFTSQAELTFSRFTSIKILSVDLLGMSALKLMETYSTLPPFIEELHLHSYTSGSYIPEDQLCTEEASILLILQGNWFPTLKGGTVPSKPLQLGWIQLMTSSNLKKWKDSRRKLESFEGFTSGRVKLTVLEDEEIGEYVNCDSILETGSWK